MLRRQTLKTFMQYRCSNVKSYQKWAEIVDEVSFISFISFMRRSMFYYRSVSTGVPCCLCGLLATSAVVGRGIEQTQVLPTLD